MKRVYDVRRDGYGNVSEVREQETVHTKAERLKSFQRLCKTAGEAFSDSPVPTYQKEIPRCTASVEAHTNN